MLDLKKARDGKGFLDGRSWGFCQGVITDGPHAGAFGWDGGLARPGWSIPNGTLSWWS